MFSLRGTFIAPESFHPPVLPAPDATFSERCPSSPAWVMLDKVAYIGDQKNGSFAQAITRTGQAVGVSLWLTDPPAPSHLCLHLSGLKVTDLWDEPTVVCLGKDIAIIRVVYNLYVRPIESAHHMGMSDCDFLVYRAHTDPPSLDVLPNPKPHMFHPSEIGFYPCGDGEEFFMAVLRSRFVHLQYDLHIFSSKTNAWTTSLVLLEPPYAGYKDDYLVHENDKVITLEGGLLGWVDLWRGILLCSVLDTNPVVRYIQFPKPMGGNMCNYLHAPARAVRDITFCDGFIRLIEMESSFVTARSANDPLSRAEMLDSGLKVGATESYTLDGWTTITWNTELASDHWTQDCTAYVTARSILSQLWYKHNSESSALEDLKMAGPLWSMHGGDVVYLIAKAKSMDKHAWAIAFNVRKSTLDGVTSFPEERHIVFSLAYQPFALSKYLSMPSCNCKVATVSSIPEREDSNNDCNTMVLVEGLDPCVTVNQLKGIVALFGELCYLKIHADEGYGLIRFVSRPCAEQAISALNGAQIGRQSVRLSWRPSNVNKQPPRWRLSERNRATYHPYAHCYGVRSCNNAAARGNYAYEDSTFPSNGYDLQQQSAIATSVAAATHCSTSGSVCPFHHQRWQPLVADNHRTHQE
ncbi:unnamed protein product [Urochloa decumbens]|uniref:RRM domain-containing protein n=1 Tax=Urochloa decumbens TaxID=240449 RepID=A0ABC8X7N5_9POAL